MNILKSIKLTNDLNKKSLRDNLYVFLHRNKNQYLNLIIKVRTADKNKSSILSLIKTVYIDLKNIEEIMIFKNYVLGQFESKLENYKSLRFSGLFFDYNIINQDSYNLNKDNNPWIQSKVNIKEFNFPLTVNYSELAKVYQNTPSGIYYSDCTGFKDAQYAKFNVTNILDIDQTAIYLVNLTMKDKIYVFTDLLNKESGEINRTFSAGIEENKLFNLENISLKNNITPLKTFDMRQEELKNNWKRPVFYACTLDCETWLDNDLVQHLMSVAIFDGRKEYFFFIKDYNSEFEMVKDVLITLLKYNNYNIYIHNGAKFDLFFLLKHFVSLTDELNLSFSPIYKDGEFIDLRIDKAISKEKCISISIKDSYKMLLCSLAKLANTFGLELNKGVFPFDFGKPENFSYIGPTPDYKYFAFDGKSLISKDEYNVLIKDNWSFRNELAKYNISDCRILYRILNKFFKLIIDKFEVDMKYNPTLSSLAFSIFRVGFIPDELKSIKVTTSINKHTNEEFVKFSLESKIDDLSMKIDSFIRQGYFGGHVDAYIPHFDNSLPQWKDQILYHYDVVSLYPSVMVNSNIPYKAISYYSGNLLENRPDLFESWTGFHRVKVNCPHDLINPILPYRTLSGVVIYPTGSWSGVYFSEEIKNAMKFGYTFEFLEGYIFLSSTEIFTQYINTLFQIKQSSQKGSAMYLISKLLQNSLFGRFGIHQELANYQILNNKDITNYLARFPMKKELDKISLSNDYSLINFSGDYSSSEANVGVSASITAFSRVVMSQVKNNPNNLLFYSDTDSAFSNSPLPESLVGNNLGQFALENKFIKFIALGPKMYAGITTEGKEIVKVKGLVKDNLPTYKELETLLDKGKYLVKDNVKLFKSYADSSILNKICPYLVQPTAQKRDYIYSGDRIIGTKNKIVKE